MAPATTTRKVLMDRSIVLFMEANSGQPAAAAPPAGRARRLAERVGEQGAEAAFAAAAIQSNGDMQLVRDAAADAEATYRLAQKKCDAPKPEQRAMSCRNAGWQALARYRVGM